MRCSIGLCAIITTMYQAHCAAMPKKDRTGEVLDEYEVFSPGGPPEGLSLEQILKGAHAKRNPILVNALDKLDYIENYNSGIRRILSEYEDFPLQPIFEISDVLFKVTLFNKNYYYDQQKEQSISDENTTENATKALENATKTRQRN